MTYDIQRLDFIVVALGAVLLTGIMLKYIWRNWK